MVERGVIKRFYVQEGRRIVADDDVMLRIDASLNRIANALDGMLAIMSGQVTVSEEDLAAMGREAMPFGPAKDGQRITMMSDNEQYVREDVGGGRWLRYRVNTKGEIIDAKIELPNGETVPFAP